jgi:hypothetical protein
MDMLYRLPFRDWLELDRSGVPAVVESEPEVGSGDGGSGRTRTGRS